MDGLELKLQAFNTSPHVNSHFSASERVCILWNAKRSLDAQNTRDFVAISLTQLDTSLTHVGVDDPPTSVPRKGSS